jgi:hypothetical protein
MAAEGYEEAVEWADRAMQAQQRYIVPMRVKLACLALLGRTDEASEWLERVLAVQPGLTIASWRASYAVTSVWAPEFAARYVDGPRKAGLPEG